MVTTPAPTSFEIAALGARRGWWTRLRGWPLLPLMILVPFVLVALGADLIAPYEPTQALRGVKIFTPPAWFEHGNPKALLGTDFQGRDILSRLIFGARVSLIVGIMGTVVAGG